MRVSESRGGDPAGSARGAGRSPVGSIQRTCAACEDEEKKTIQTKRAPSANAGAVPGPALDGAALVAPGAGEPLPAPAARFFGERFRFDFSRVRIHHDHRAD